MHFLSKSPFYCVFMSASQLSTIQTSYSFKFVPPKIDQEGLSASQLSTQKSVPLTVIVQPLPTLWAPNLLLKTICGIGGGGNGGGDDGCGEKKTNAIPILGFVKRGWLVVLPLTYLSALSFSSHSAPSSQCDLLTTMSTRLAMVLTKA